MIRLSKYKFIGNLLHRDVKTYLVGLSLLLVFSFTASYFVTKENPTTYTSTTPASKLKNNTESTQTEEIKEEPKEDVKEDTEKESDESDDIVNANRKADIEEENLPNQASNVNPEETDTEAADKRNWWDYPEQILQVTKSGDDLLVLVNKQYKLPSTYVPSDLTTFADWNVGISGKTIATTNESLQLRSEAVSHLADLMAAASENNTPLKVISAYRSYATQQSTYQYWVDQNGGNTDEADKISARPGHSQHQLGTAVDFSTYDGLKFDEFTNTPAEIWLRQHAWEYGYALSYPPGAEEITGYSPESWHYRYIGVDNAASWHASNKILELWLREAQ